MNALAEWLGNLLKPIIIAAVKEAFAQMKDTAEIGKPNEQLQKQMPDSDDLRLPPHS